jgi:Xaa-Pro aminopeptidase
VNPYPGRLQRVRGALAEASADAVLLTPGPDFSYLTGISVYAGERLLALIVPREGVPRFVAPEMNRDQLPGPVAGAEVRTWTDAEGYRSAAAAALAASGLERGVVAVDDEMRAAFLLDLQSVCPDARWQSAGEVMRRLRIRKDAAELDKMARAAAVADAAIPAAAAACRPGRSEEAVAADVRAAMEQFPFGELSALGSPLSVGEKPVFTESGEPRAESCPSVYGVIVASGPNSALPHHHTGTRALQAGDVVVLDYGCELEGYHSDITLTLSLGEPDAERERVYRVVWEAQQRALEAVRPGVPAEAIDRAARETIAAAGYGDAFLHRAGHGIGLQVHEPPYLVAGNMQPLEEGMCFSIEPGIYLAGRFGVRLEVIVTVTADGVELMNAPSSPTFQRVS